MLLVGLVILEGVFISRRLCSHTRLFHLSSFTNEALPSWTFQSSGKDSKQKVI